MYEGDLRRLVHLLKYDGMRPLAKALAAKMASVVPRVGAVELVVPVPLHRSRRWSREFNQAELLARELSRLAGIPCRPGGFGVFARPRRKQACPTVSGGKT